MPRMQGAPQAAHRNANPPSKAATNCRRAKSLGALCDSCPLQDRPKVFALPVHNPKLLLVGETPARTEVQKGYPFAGASGELLDRICARIRMPRSQVYITNALLCWAGRNLKPGEWKKAVECCRPRLQRELRSVKKSGVILACGKRALQSLTTKAVIFDWIGGPLKGARIQKGPKNKKVVLADFSAYTILPSLHPAYTFKEGKGCYRPVIRIHFARAWDMANERLPPWRRARFRKTVGPKMVRHLRRMVREHLPIGFDVETIGTDPLHAKIMCLGIGNRRRVCSIPWDRYHAGVYGDIRGIDDYPEGKVIRKLVRFLLHSRAYTKIAQNRQYDTLACEAHGMPIGGRVEDTMYAHAAVAHPLPHNLGFMCAVEFHGPRWKTIHKAASDAKGAESWAKRDPEKLKLYNGDDVLNTVRLWPKLRTRMHHTENARAIYEEYLDQDVIAMNMRRTGVRRDPVRAEKHRTVLTARIQRAGREVKAVAAAAGVHDFNPASHPQRIKFVFHTLGATPVKYTENDSPSLDESVLTKLLWYDNQLIQAYARAELRRRRYAKLLSTYIDGLHPDAHNFIHPEWKPHAAVTGRWGCFIMQIPKPRKVGKVTKPGLRDMFIANSDQEYIVEADYSQLELRILAYLSGDEALITAYEQKQDVHTLNAKLLFGTEVPTDAQRDLAKRFVYALSYGGTANTIWESLVVDFPDLTLEHVGAMMRKWNLAHQAIVNWAREQLAFAHDHRWISEPIFGRREYFYAEPEPTKVVNYPIQASAAAIINRAIKKVAKAIREYGTIMFQYHDALICSTRDPIRCSRMLRRHMEIVVKLRGVERRFPVDVKVSPRFKVKRESKKVWSFETRGGKRIPCLSRWGEGIECKTTAAVRKLVA